MINKVFLLNYATMQKCINLLFKCIIIVRGFSNCSLSRLMDLPLGELGLGQIDKTNKKNPVVNRTVWYDPSPEVVLYSLYRFAEACGDYYQFSLETLLDDSIDRDGVSPSRIFGLDKDTMVKILNGLSINYPDYISASFTLDLDNITLREDKKSTDILALF